VAQGRHTIEASGRFNDFQTSNRAGAGAELMKLVVEKLSAEDMVSIAAYLAARE
jgi:cytochrome c553